MTTAKKSFVKGAIVLGIAGVIIKALGAFFRIPLANFIGDQGMAYYQAAYPIYVLFLTLATAGFPVAISRMVSEREAIGQYNEAYRVFKISFALMAIIGAVSAGVCFFGAGVIVSIIKVPGAKLAMMAIAPALLFVPMMAAFRGYFQGKQNMSPTAVSQVVEQFFRVGIGLSLAIVLLKSGLEQAAAGAAFGATAGAVGGLLFIVFVYLHRRGAFSREIADTKHLRGESSGEIVKKVLIIAIPITIGAAIMPIMNFIDVGIVVRRLMATGWDSETAESLYGQLSGFVGPLINFPQVLTQAVAMSLVPAIAAAHRQNDLEFMRSNIASGLRMAIVVGFPCAFGFMTLAEPILLLLYPTQKASAMSAASCLIVMGFGVIFLSTVQTLTGVLQGVGKQMIPVRNLAIGAVFKIIMTYTLTGIPAVNINGAAAGTVTAYIIAAALNLVAVRKYTGTQIKIGLTFGRPLVSVLVMSAAAWLSYRGFYAVLGSNGIACLAAICVAALVYSVMIFVTRAVTMEEVAMLPKGKKLVKLMGKFKKN